MSCLLTQQPNNHQLDLAFSSTEQSHKTCVRSGVAWLCVSWPMFFAGFEKTVIDLYSRLVRIDYCYVYFAVIS